MGKRIVYLNIKLVVQDFEKNNDDEELIDIVNDMDYTFTPAEYHTGLKVTDTEIISYEFVDKSGNKYNP